MYFIYSKLLPTWPYKTMSNIPVKLHTKQCHKSNVHIKNALLPYSQLFCLCSQAENNFAGSEIKK